MTRARTIAFSGVSGSGKTTLICRLTSLYAALGTRVAYLKHTHHPSVRAGEGDSARVRAAGAVESIVAGEWGALRESDASFHSWTGVDELQALILAPFDLLLIEGFRDWAGPPRVLVERERPGSASSIDYAAVVSDAPVHAERRFRFSELADLATFLDTIDGR